MFPLTVPILRLEQWKEDYPGTSKQNSIAFKNSILTKWSIFLGCKDGLTYKNHSI